LSRNEHWRTGFPERLSAPLPVQDAIWGIAATIWCQ